MDSVALRAQSIVREQGMCGELAPDGERVCILPSSYEHDHDWGTYAGVVDKLKDWVVYSVSGARGPTLLEKVVEETQELMPLLIAVLKRVRCDRDPQGRSVCGACDTCASVTMLEEVLDGQD